MEPIEKIKEAEKNGRDAIEAARKEAERQMAAALEKSNLRIEQARKETNKEAASLLKAAEEKLEGELAVEKKRNDEDIKKLKEISSKNKEKTVDFITKEFYRRFT